MTIGPQAPTLAPLEPLYVAWGAVLEPFAGRSLPAHFGQPLAEYHALRGGCGLVDRSFTDRLELRGEDRVRFLQGLLTCDVKALGPGQGAYGFFTGPQGKVLADVVVLALEDRLWLELPAGSVGAMRAHLEKYVIADRVEVGSLEAMSGLALVGPAAQSVLERLLGDSAELPAAIWSHFSGRIAGVEVRAVRQGRLGGPGWALWVEASQATPLAEVLHAEAEVTPVGWQASEVLRVEAGVGSFGGDFGADNFPQETGAEAEAVSYSKGCYLGQEIVARIHYRGGVQRGLRGLRFAPPEPPAAGTAVLAEGQRVGVVGSAVRSPALGVAIGLAVLHQRAWQAGALLELEGGGGAELLTLPVATPEGTGR